MIIAPHYHGKTIAIFGLARTGISAAQSLMASGSAVLAWDDNEAARSTATHADIPLVDLYTADFSTFGGLVLAPGVPLNFPEPHPLVLKARAHNIDILCDIEVFAHSRSSLPAHRVIGITGTNGKSTTTALIHHILKSAGVPAVMGGNIGLPILSQTALPAGGVYVLELSSFQIDLTQTLACDVAVLLNITPDHLDRHGDMAGYAQAKTRLFDMQTAQGVAVIGMDDDYCQQIAMHRRTEVCFISATDDEVLAQQADWPTLQGPHNAQNAAAAIAACSVVGVAMEDIVAALKTYPGLPHRMERIATVNDVLYINDSKATNPESTAPALQAYQNIYGPKIHWIVGGKRKADDLNACLPYLDNVKQAYLIGSSEAVFDDVLSAHVNTLRCSTLDVAVAQAHTAAEPGDVVLLSPAAASQDQFKDYEARGSYFRTLVEALVHA